jgi:hypothetical protein
LWPYTEGKTVFISFSGSVANPKSTGPVELGLNQDMSSGRPILAYEIEKSIENFTFCRVIVFCGGLDLPPGIWKSHMRL